VNDDTRDDGRSQYLPRVGVAPDGRVDVAYYDRRSDPNDVMTDVSLASSTDRGASFPTQVRVTDRRFSSRVGPEGPGGEADLGTRIGLVSVEDRALAVWTDTRNGSVASARQDIYAAVVVDLPEPERGVPWTMVVVGSSALALILVAAGAWAWRRRRGP
jgi:hypothetical protein